MHPQLKTSTALRQTHKNRQKQATYYFTNHERVYELDYQETIGKNILVFVASNGPPSLRPSLTKN